MSASEQPAIAVIGMAGRFPDAPDLHAFWRNLEQGRESLVSYTDEELLQSGLPPELLHDPNFVKKGTSLENAEMFDAGFFGFSPREAEILDPQQRIFLECAWEALEDSGHAGDEDETNVGVYAGASMNAYFLSSLLRAPELLQSVSFYQLMMSNDKDFLATRASYKLNLKGPSMTVQTACSTSLVAVTMAVNALRAFECNMALAGGVSLRFPQKMGYMYAEGMVFSPDGHCRPFDAEGKGMRAGDGVGIVVLKRLDDALRDGDSIRAILRGAAINNDGSAKMGYTAPSVDGQSEAILAALKMSGVSPETIDYVEAHGTATPLGDPIEIAALEQVYRKWTDKKQYCAIGSLKSNIGHLDVAAGVAGLMKTILALEHRQIPPSLHFNRPNPQIDFANSPFFVNTRLTEWKAKNTPRRAAVSSFGIGGTNAHVVLEESPELKSEARWPAHLLVLSARSAAALDSATDRMARHLADNPGLSLGDLCYTLQAGRRSFPHRRMLTGSSVEEMRRGLDGSSRQPLPTAIQESGPRPVAFLFSGQGSQHTGMARDLYEVQPEFRRNLDLCSEILAPHLKCDLREQIYGSAPGEAGRLDETWLAQPALFAIEYSLARMWMAWGVQPDAFIGHSIGEYAAACLAGVFSLEDALSLVAARGRIMQQMPRGSMLAVRSTEKELRALISGDIAVAATNAPSLCTVAGPVDEIEAFEQQIKKLGVDARPLHTSHAFHSALMDAALDPFLAEVQKRKLHRPDKPFISNLSGTWILPEQAVDPHYWAQHLRAGVRFSAGIRELTSKSGRILLEVGPGQALTALARECTRGIAGCDALASLPHPKDPHSAAFHILTTVGKLWLAGIPIRWTALHEGEKLRRISLPTYPFEKKRYFIEPQLQPPTVVKKPLERKADIADWFYEPSWRRTSLPSAISPEVPAGPWLVFADSEDTVRGTSVAVTIVKPGSGFARLENRVYTIDPNRGEDYTSLLDAVSPGGLPPRILYMWQTCGGRASFHHLLRLAQACGEVSQPGPSEWVIVSRGMHRVNGREKLDPEQALVLGPCRVIPWEYASIKCRSIDVDETAELAELIPELMLEPEVSPSFAPVAYRDGYRWEQRFEPVRLNGKKSPVREHGVYLITGGTGGIGLVLAEHLAATAHARLALLARTPLPDPAEWLRWLETHEESDKVSGIIRTIRKLEQLGAEVLCLAADVCDRDAMKRAVAQVHERFGPIHGAIHAAGRLGEGLIQLKSFESAENTLAPKVEGTLILESVLLGDPLDFVVLCSSISAICSVQGASDYSSANAFMDAYAGARFQGGSCIVRSVNWDAWQEVGMAVNNSFSRNKTELGQPERAMVIRPAEGVEAFRRVIATPLPQVAVITRDLAEISEAIDNARQRDAEFIEASEKADSAAATAGHARPALTAAFAAPETPTQEKIAAIWKQMLGIEEIGIDDDFFELGGHSLLATGVLSRVRAIFGVSGSLRLIFEAPTVRKLAGVVDTLSWARTKPEPSPSEEREEIVL